MATTVIVGNPALNPTVNPGNDFSYQYNPADPIAAQQAQREVEARAEMDRQAMEDEYAAQLQQTYAAQLQQTYAAQLGTPQEVDTSHFDPNQEIDFTSFAKNNNWADSSTFRRQELANKLLEELKAKGADANYLEGARQFIKAKGEEWKQPIDAPDRAWLDVGGDIIAGGARALNSLAGLAGDVGRGLGIDSAIAVKEGSDNTVGAFERNMQSAETANLIKRANELISEGRTKDLAKHVLSNPSLAAYAGLPELLGAKGIGVAAKGVVKGIEGGLKVANVAQNVAEGTKAAKALELGKQAAGLGTVMAASGRGSILNTATTNGVPITDDVTDIANTNALAQGALGAFGAAAGSVESILAKSPIFSLFSKAGDVDRLLITAATAPKAAVSTILATAKTAGVEMSQEYAEGWVESLLQAKISPDGTTRDLNQLDYDQAAAQGTYGALLSAGPGGLVGHMEARAKNQEIDAYNSIIKDKQAEAADVQNKAEDAKRVADTINTAATTADEALATLNAERAQRVQTQIDGAAEVDRLRTEAALADPLVQAEATQRLIEATTRQAEIAQRRSVLESVKDAQFQTIDAQTQATEDQAAAVRKAELDQSIRNAGMDVAARPGLEWDTNFTRGELDRLRQIAPTVDFTTSKDPLKTITRAAKEAGNDPLVLGQLVRAKNLVQGTLTSNRPLAATARRVLAEGIASGQPFDVESAIVQAAPYLAEPEVRMSFLSTLPRDMVTQLAQLDSGQPTVLLPANVGISPTEWGNIGTPTQRQANASSGGGTSSTGVNNKQTIVQAGIQLGMPDSITEAAEWFTDEEYKGISTAVDFIGDTVRRTNMRFRHDPSAAERVSTQDGHVFIVTDSSERTSATQEETAELVYLSNKLSELYPTRVKKNAADAIVGKIFTDTLGMKPTYPRSAFRLLAGEHRFVSMTDSMGNSISANYMPDQGVWHWDAPAGSKLSSADEQRLIEAKIDALYQSKNRDAIRLSNYDKIATRKKELTQTIDNRDYITKVSTVGSEEVVSLGSYSVRDNVVRVAHKNDRETIAHEIGHGVLVNNPGLHNVLIPVFQKYQGVGTTKDYWRASIDEMFATYIGGEANEATPEIEAVFINYVNNTQGIQNPFQGKSHVSKVQTQQEVVQPVAAQKFVQNIGVQQSLPGFAHAIAQDNFIMPQGEVAQGAIPSTPDLFPNSPEFLNKNNPTPLETAAGYLTSQPQRTHARAAVAAEAMQHNDSIVNASDAYTKAITDYIAAYNAVYGLSADDVSPEANAARQLAVEAFRVRMDAKATLAKAQESFLQEITKSTKLQSLIVQYSDLIEKSKRNDKFSAEETRFTYAEDSAQVAADLVLEQMEQYLGIQRTDVPVLVTGEETELPGVKFNLTEYSPRVDNASIRRAAQVKNSPASNQARAARVGAVQAAVKSLNLGRVTTPEQIKNRRDAQYSKIADAEQMLQDAESRVSEAQATVDGIIVGDKSLAAVALRARLAREKQTVTALKTKVSSLTIGLKKIDPVAYHDMRVEQARTENEAKISELQSVLDNAQAARDAYVAENAVGAGKKYQSDIKKMDAAIDRAKKKLFDLRGEPFDYDTQKQKIETAYQEAVLKAVKITPEALSSFDAKAKAASGKTVVPSDFIAAYDEGQQIRGTATLLDDGNGWEINYTDARGEQKNTAVASSEEVFQFFRAQNLQPTLRSRGANQSTHAMKAIATEERGNRFTRPFLKALVTVMGESRAKNMLNAVDWALFSLANRGYALRELANRATANGYGTNLQDELQLNLAKWTAYQSQPGTTEQTHKDMEQSFYEMHQKLPKTAQPYFDEYAHAVAARSRHNWLTRDEELDRNTGLPKDRTSGFEWYDPRTGEIVEDHSAEEYFKYADSVILQEDRVALDAAVKYLADMGLTVSHIEARNGVISEATLQQRIAEHDAKNYYLPLRDENNSANTTKRTKGRYSKAADPVVRMLMDMQGRIGRAARMSMVQDLHDFFVENPAPDVVTINTEVEVADGRGNVKWVMDDPFSNRSVRIIKADGTRARLTFADKGHGARLAKMLTPQNIPQWVSMANTTKRYFSNMMTTFSPKMWPVQLVRDMMIIPFNFEQASRGLFGSTKSLKLAAKTSALIPVNLMRTIRGQITPDKKSVLAKELLADGGMIQMAHRNDFQAQKDILVNEADYKPTSGRRNLFGKTVKAIHYTENVLHSLDAVSRETYAQVATTELFGRKIRTAEDMALFKSQFPAEWQKILLGTKDITLNFENYGQSPYLRATIPFFGTAMNATFHALPRSLSTKSGIAYMTMLAGASYIAAMSGGAGSGEDPDGKKKFYRNSNLGRSIEIGGIAFPLPQEMYFAHMFGTAIAATQDGQWDFGQAASEVGLSFVEGFSPVQANVDPESSQPFVDRVLAAGPYGFILQPMITGNDAFGRPLANPKPVGPDGKRIEDPADWEGAYKNSAEWAKITTATLADGTGGVIDVSPGGAETAARIMLGGVYLFAKDYGKDVSTVDNLLSRFTPKENPYKMGQEYNELESKYNRLSRAPAVAGDMLNPASTAKRLIDANKKADAQISRQVGALTKAMTTAKLQGNAANAEAYQSQIDALNASREQNKGSVMKQIQELEK